MNETPISTITPRVLKQKLASAEKPVLLDVRESEELHGELGHVEGVVHVPLGSLARRLDELRPLLDREIIVLCRSGARAYTAAQFLAKAGFSRVSVLAGGMLTWRMEG